MSLFERIIEAVEEPKPLTNGLLASAVPLFVKGSTTERDHKCEGCVKFIPGNGEYGSCLAVEGRISGPNGTCQHWKSGKPQMGAQTQSGRLTYAESGYVEAPAGMEINCGTCRFVKGPLCQRWRGTVEEFDCCLVFSNPKVKTPG